MTVKLSAEQFAAAAIVFYALVGVAGNPGPGLLPGLPLPSYPRVKGSVGPCRRGRIWRRAHPHVSCSLAGSVSCGVFFFSVLALLESFFALNWLPRPWTGFFRIFIDRSLCISSLRNRQLQFRCHRSNYTCFDLRYEKLLVRIISYARNCGYIILSISPALIVSLN